MENKKNTKFDPYTPKEKFSSSSIVWIVALDLFFFLLLPILICFWR